MRLREEDPPSYAVPDTRQFRCRRGIWYAWAPRKSSTSAQRDVENQNENEVARPDARPKALFSWQRLDKSSQDACSKITHEIEGNTRPQLEVGFSPIEHCEAKASSRPRVGLRPVPVPIPEQSISLDLVLRGTRASSRIPVIDPGWSENLAYTTKRLTELYTVASPPWRPNSQLSPMLKLILRRYVWPGPS